MFQRSELVSLAATLLLLSCIYVSGLSIGLTNQWPFSNYLQVIFVSLSNAFRKLLMPLYSLLIDSINLVYHHGFQYLSCIPSRSRLVAFMSEHIFSRWGNRPDWLTLHWEKTIILMSCFSMRKHWWERDELCWCIFDISDCKLMHAYIIRYQLYWLVNIIRLWLHVFLQNGLYLHIQIWNWIFPPRL